ncbi:RidA family protein [Halostreptopolyspora alba]|uniref:RidA family protein n=1 Tax=Halostreptopolyspora alba TaxID=2487137 RepID=A0A3N0E634_9ACTN|nr:RidA family protein [Nocardiopsaceae bacterium YIM 96095]
MPTPEERLAELGWDLPDVVKPIASYTQTVRTGDHVYVSGQVPLVDGAPAGTGKVGAEVTLERATELAAICALNGIAALKAEVGELSTVRRVVKLLGFVASDPSFHAQPKVINGASDLVGEVFGPAGVHARSAVGVTALPLDVPVEVEMIAEVG